MDGGPDGLLVLAATILGAFSGLELSDVRTYLEDASWWWIPVAFVAASCRG